MKFTHKLTYIITVGLSLLFLCSETYLISAAAGEEAGFLKTLHAKHPKMKMIATPQDDPVTLSLRRGTASAQMLADQQRREIELKKELQTELEKVVTNCTGISITKGKLEAKELNVFCFDNPVPSAMQSIIDTPLGMIIRNKAGLSEEKVLLLTSYALSKGASPSFASSHFTFTPLTLAIEQGNEELANLLAAHNREATRGEFNRALLAGYNQAADSLLRQSKDPAYLAQTNSRAIDSLLQRLLKQEVVNLGGIELLFNYAKTLEKDTPFQTQLERQKKDIIQQARENLLAAQSITHLRLLKGKTEVVQEAQLAIEILERYSPTAENY